MQGHICYRTFECPACKSKMWASKKGNRATSNGHIKLLYCYKCKKDMDMVQIDIACVRNIM